MSSLEKKQAATRERVKRYRERAKALQNKVESVTSSGVTGEDVTYPPILYALIDPIKRAKLEKIYQSLKAHNKADKVFYGFPGLGGVPFDIVGDYLEATR